MMAFSKESPLLCLKRLFSMGRSVVKGQILKSIFLGDNIIYRKTFQSCLLVAYRPETHQFHLTQKVNRVLVSWP